MKTDKKHPFLMPLRDLPAIGVFFLLVISALTILAINIFCTQIGSVILMTLQIDLDTSALAFLLILVPFIFLIICIVILFLIALSWLRKAQAQENSCNETALHPNIEDNQSSAL